MSDLKKPIKFMLLIFLLNITILLFFYVLSAYAEWIHPANKVKSYITVRNRPRASATVVGRLSLTESAELLETLPEWYKVKLNNGKTGYVKKAWSEVSLYKEGGSVISRNEDLVIGSWHIESFGKKRVDQLDYNKIAGIIASFDVVAIQGVSGKHYASEFEKLLRELESRKLNYSYFCSEETGYSGSVNKKNPAVPIKAQMERYAFMWNTDRVRLVNPETEYQFAAQPALDNTMLRYVPIFADFEVTKGNAFDFRIMNVHTTYEKEINDTRKSELLFIHGWIIEQVRDEKNKEKNIIVIGTFNANPDGQSNNFDNIIKECNEYRVLFKEPLKAGEAPVGTIIQKNGESDLKALNSPVFDHVLVSRSTDYAMPNNPMTRAANDLGVVSFDQAAYWGKTSWKFISDAVSDHRPIWFKMNYFAEDKD